MAKKVSSLATGDHTYQLYKHRQFHNLHPHQHALVAVVSSHLSQSITVICMSDLAMLAQVQAATGQ